MPSIALAGDRALTRPELDARDLRQRDPLTAGGREEQISDGVRAAPDRVDVTDRHIIVPLAAEEPSYRAPANADLDEVRDVRHVDAEAGRGFSVDVDLQLRQR